MNEIYEDSIVGNCCTLLNPYNGYTEGRVIEDCGIEIVVLLTNGKEVIEYRDEVEKARAFDPFGHAGFDPSGKIRMTP